MKKLWVCLIFAGAIAVAYYNALGNGFVFDDYRLVVKNPVLREAPSLTQWFISPSSFGQRPFRHLSYLVDIHLGGMEPWVFHLSNLIYHWLCACLVFLITLRLTNTSSSRVSEQDNVAAPSEKPVEEWRWRPAVFVTALWALHPVLTDAVTYISGRRDILGGLGLFLGFWAYLNFRAVAGQDWRKYGWLFVAGVAYGLGILSKESAIVLPALCWFYDCQQKGIRVALRRHGVVYGAGLLLGAIVLWQFAGSMVSAAYNQATFIGGSLAGHVATVARLWFHYLSLMVYPHTLLADYSYNAFPVSLSLREPAAIIALLGLANVIGGLVVLARRFPLCGYGGWWMLVCILPVSHIIPIREIAAEHYLYVPLFGFCLIVGVLFDALCGGDEKTAVLRLPPRAALVYGVVACLLVAFVSRTIVRNRDWANEETFWTAVTYTAPQSARGHYNLANTYKRLKRLDDAAREFSATLAISAQHADAIVGLGELSFEGGHYGQAFSYAQQARLIAPQNPRVLYLSGWSSLAIRNLDTAEQFFHQAAELMPNSPGVYAGLEAVAKERGDKEAESRWANKRQTLEAKSGKTG